MLKVGDEFNGFSVVRQLGAGGMGQVYLVHNRLLNRLEALKVMYPNLAGSIEFRKRFEREAMLAASLDHPNIVAVYDSDPDSEVVWMAMQFVEGCDGQSLVKDGDVMSVARAVDVIQQAASGIDFAHSRRVLHRDIKPANLMVTSGWDGTARSSRVLVADFGIAKSMDSTSMTQTGITVGSLAYMAPEVIRNDVVDHRSDVYALGCTLYALLTGSPPFVRANAASMMHAHLTETPPKLSGVRPDIPRALDDVIDTALAKVPADRYNSCAEFALAACAAVLNAEARPSAAWIADAERTRPRLMTAADNYETAHRRLDDTVQRAYRPGTVNPSISNSTVALGSKRTKLGLIVLAATAVPLVGAGVWYGVYRESDSGPAMTSTVVSPSSGIKRPTLLATIPTGGTGNSPAVDPGVRRLYAADTTAGKLAIIDLTTRSVTGTVDIPKTNAFPVVDTASHLVYVNRYGIGEGAVLVIDPAAKSVVATVPVVSNPGGIAFDPTSHSAFVTHVNGMDLLSVMNTGTMTAGDDIQIGVGYSFPIAIDSMSHTAFVGGRAGLAPNYAGPGIAIIDTISQSAKGTIPTPVDVRDIVVDPTSHLLFAADMEDHAVLVIDPISQKVTASIPIGSSPVWLADDPTTGTVYVSSYKDGVVSMIDAASRTVTATIPLPGGVAGRIAVDSAAHTVYVGTANGVAVIGSE